MPPVVAYHGTRTAALQSIADNGILAHPFARYHPARFYTGERGASVYVTENPKIAADWALSEVSDPAEVTILQVELPPDRLVPDEQADQAERFVGNIPPEWIKAAYPVQSDGKLGPGIAFHAGRAEDAPKARRFVAMKHVVGAHDSVMAMDRAPFPRSGTLVIALDRGSVRWKSGDGHLHIGVSNISKATVNPYKGAEIPNAEKLGLDLKKTYYLLRDPKELEKAAPTFNNLPLQYQHQPSTAEDHPQELTVGSSGTDAGYKHPFLQNSLVVWMKPAIDAVEKDELREISCGYHYDPDMTPGTYEGKHYDGVMRNIRGNHIALVKEGRAGSDVLVADSKHGFQQKGFDMKLTPAALVSRAALTVYLRPRMAQDAKLDLSEVVKGITSKTFDPKALALAVRTAADGKLAKDADLADLDNLIDALKPDAESADESALDPNGGIPLVRKKEDSEDSEPEFTLAKVKEFLQAHNVDPEVIEQLDAFAAEPDDGGGMDETPEEKAAREKKEAEDKAAKAAKDGIIPKNQEGLMVTKDEMNREITERVKQAQDEATANQKAIREAERFVRPWVGDLAMDSAATGADVYRAALSALGYQGADKLHVDALKPILEAQAKPGARDHSRRIAEDAATGTVKPFAERFPTASGISIQT